METENPMRAARKEMRLTQVEFAKLLDVTQATISRMELNADQIDRRTMLAIERLKIGVQ